MNYFIFDFNKHINLIDSFLTSASLAHKQEKKTEDWFYWKFRDNPFGETILACAEEDGIIAGCVAFGMQDFICDQNVVNGAMSFETFVHPEYQGKGLFKKLIHNAESEAKSRGLKLLLNFPNSNSLPGFLKLGWTMINNSEYWIKPRINYNFLRYFKDLKNGFKPNTSNLNQLNKKFLRNYKQSNEFGFFLEINSEYLKWRFFTYPNAEYIIVNDENCYSVGRVGKRGNLAEIQVLFVTPKEQNTLSLRKLLKVYKNQSRFDLISFPISINNRLRPFLKRCLFIKVRNNTNVCYKILDETLQIEMDKIELSAINAHTY